ncbi:MAG: glycosyltransferase family 2 protein [Rhodocyclales bacterium]|nr:glycosyltransferase family 2 protein [Rhodocyclales bacterium]
MTPGLVSTIIPVYNRPAQLREAVASVLAQDYRPIEIIIVDDGSTDDTFAVAQELAAEHPGIIRAETQTNVGPGMARERGRQMAQGEFIQYLDSDDVLLPGKFLAQVTALRAHPGADVAYGMTRYRHPDGRIEPGPWKGSGVAREAMFPPFLLERWWDTPNPLYRASVRAGGQLVRPAPGGRLGIRLPYSFFGTRLTWCAVCAKCATMRAGACAAAVRWMHRASVSGHAATR